MVNVEIRKAYSEVNTILELLGNTYSSKIPNKIKEVFKREMDKEYVPLIDISKPVKEQNLRRKTIAIISALNLQYWCENEAKKQELQKIYKENGIKYQEELREKYNPDNIFKNKNKTTDTVEKEETALVNIESIPLYKRIFNKIKNFFTRGV